MRRYRNVVAFLCIIMMFLHVQTVNAYHNQTYNWSYKPAPQHTPATTEEMYEQMLAQADGYYIGDTNEKVLYLTFDNGYENGYTESILDTLKEKEVPGAFFVTGHYLKSASDLVKRMVTEGHIVGNHSFHHPSLPAVSDERLVAELEGVKELFTKLTGEQEMRYLRPPRGEFSERTLMKTKELGYTNVFWSLAYKDWDPDRQKGGDYAYEQVMKRIHPGAIMLVHAVSSDNAEALPRIIDECHKLGYTFRSLDDLSFSHVLP
ncbi:delta-lactam-biosynthetic de-N-acetylase [Shouchella lonarensis]|uniref:Peptidoglycan-N-acetylmuramic acid deacetylase n=1 Tax=Shouchella lonarensis TaxID=1464122 RepID=A0A1G6GH24_9BACI|nr:delta-lactam-biosynthetic de-N-acetylase [Shouchella lonarensis]SDB81055.1 peptidoglycan-N-acetylmuramic acid deacetylase [Shouchella lonarensis]